MNLTYTIQITGDNNKELGDIAYEAALRIEAESKILQTGPKTGREYRRPGGRIHIASADGEAPAVDTGFLINSIQTMRTSETSAEITIAAEYAEVLEFGKERPFVRPAIDHVLKQLASGDILAELRE